MSDETKKQKEKKEKDNRVKKEPEKDLFAWKAPARPFKTRGREFWVSTIAIASIGGFILFLIEGVMPVILIISIVFLFYVLSTVAPEEIEYKITNKGVKIADKRTEWGFIKRFWFGKRFDSDILIFEIATILGRLELVIDKEDKDKLTKVLEEYIEHNEVPPNNLDKAAGWFSEKLPGN